MRSVYFGSVPIGDGVEARRRSPNGSQTPLFSRSGNPKGEGGARKRTRHYPTRRRRTVDARTFRAASEVLDGE